MKLNIPLVSNQNDGFGVMAKEIARSMQDRGHTVINDTALNESSDVVLNFAHPHQFRYSDRVPSVGYMPWESTAPRDGWIKHMSMCDDIWVTSPWLADVVSEWGFENAYVYEHGLNLAFAKERPKPNPKKIRFLHMGLEAYRKGAYETIRSFRMAFGDRDDVELVLKTKATNMPRTPYRNITVNEDNLSLEELSNLYYSCDVFLLPSYGEGFGLPARDAMATGMPLIHTAGFAPYEDMMNSNLIIPSKSIDSSMVDTINVNIQLVHPGLLFQPNIDAMVDILRDVADNFDHYSNDARRRAPQVIDRYDWDNHTIPALNRLFALK